MCQLNHHFCYHLYANTLCTCMCVCVCPMLVPYLTVSKLSRAVPFWVYSPPSSTSGETNHESYARSGDIFLLKTHFNRAKHISSPLPYLFHLSNFKKQKTPVAWCWEEALPASLQRRRQWPWRDARDLWILHPLRFSPKVRIEKFWRVRRFVRIHH